MEPKERAALAAPFVAPGPPGVSIRDRLKGLTDADEKVLRLVGAYLGALAGRDLKTRCSDGLEHSNKSWARRKRDLTPLSSSRWAGSLTKATHDQWALSRRAQAAHLTGLDTGIHMLRHRLSLPIGEKGTKRAPGGYRSKREWFTKSRRLACLEERREQIAADREAGRVHVVRGGRKLANTRHNLTAAGLTEPEWRERWDAARWFLSADGESGKSFGNETIRVSPAGEVSIKLPTPLAAYANSRNGRYTLTAKVAFPRRGTEWRDRVCANRAVAYRIHYDTSRARWYLDAAWTRPVVQSLPLAAAQANGVVGVDTNADHFAAWRLDSHGNPVGEPHRFPYDLTGTASHRDAQMRHAITRLLHWAQRCGVRAIAIEDLDFSQEKTREKHGRRKKFRQLISGIPTSKLRVRLASMAAEQNLAIVAVDPAYTSIWGAQHWQKPMATPHRTTTRHDAASIAIGRRALGLPIRRRMAPPHDDRSDRRGHRTVQAEPGARGREETRRRIPGPRTRCAQPGRGAKAGDQHAQHRPGRAADGGRSWHQDPLPLSPQERFIEVSPSRTGESASRGPSRSPSPHRGGR
ncbi:IS200/IS605 family accessory protein TnpB-related protein [Streptomyces sp. NPDC091371]|uniref:IS200/IS605 family accessory protein TnpB-related protein n=1 Tax=Streptomyces sp. NPDC091371 TaxID=3155303 RepID=UPI003415E39F